MTHPEVEISVVRSSDELELAWKEVEFMPYGGEVGRAQWLDVVGKDSHDFLVARLADFAVGSVVIKWSGPVGAEKEFSEALTEAFPDEQPTPVIYYLHVHPYHRRQKIADSLTESVELLIVEKPDTVQRAALYTGISNEGALSLYRNRDYQVLKYRGQETVDFERTAIDEHGKYVRSVEPVYLMTKDVSKTA